MAHMVLPDSSMAAGASHGPKFVDIAIPALIEKMERLGANRRQLVVKLVGGAQVLKTGAKSDLFNIGGRNAASARQTLNHLGLRVKAEDVGGHRGRTVRLYVDNGRLLVSRVGETAVELT